MKDSTDSFSSEIRRGFFGGKSSVFKGNRMGDLQDPIDGGTDCTIFLAIFCWEIPQFIWVNEIILH